MSNEDRSQWWQRGIVYQIYPRSFADSTGNGIGDLQGILNHLDYLNDGTPGSLGIDAIWISPFYPSPMADFGYDVADYCDVHELFGDLATFDRLIVAAHERNIRVIIDLVPNHTSDQHPWFVESRSNRANPKRDWYIWRSPASDGSYPNNWGSVFGGPAWTWDENTEQFYYHQFLKEQPDLNWRNPEVREAMFDVVRFWLERGVDGFRVDVIGMMIKDEAMRDNPPNPDASPDLPEEDIYGRQLHLYNEDQPEVHEIIRRFRGILEAYSTPEQVRVGIGEVWYELPQWVRYYGRGNDELHLPFNFRLMWRPWEMAVIQQAVDELEAALPQGAWPNYVLGNHDWPRLASRFGAAQARPAALLLLTLRGTPTLYYGDELGLPDGIIPPEHVQDPYGQNLGTGRNRDVARTPMQWDNSPNAGFSTVEPWLPVSLDYETRNVASQSTDPISILNLYRRLIWLRRRTPALQSGDYISLASDTPNLYCYWRTLNQERYLIAINFAGEPQTVVLPETGGEILLSTHLDREERITDRWVSLRSHEGVIIKII